jgi:Kef-type K+ transport system membrane component KefB
LTLATLPTLTSADLARFLLALTLLLAAAHSVGYVFARARQPRVIGEIVGGLVLGPTVLGLVAPRVEAAIFPASGAVPVALDGLAQLGLLLLMFGAGAEMRSSFKTGERRTVAAITVIGMALPALAGLAFVRLLPSGYGIGTAHAPAAFALVFVLAIAVTSIPVISRIMFDLGILETSFARIVLSVAVLEDVMVYVVLAVALGMVAAASGDTFGVPAWLGIVAGSAASIVFHVAATLGLLGLTLWIGPRIYRGILGFRFNLLRRGSQIGFQLAFLLTLSVLAAVLGVTPLFGAFVAGIVVGTASSGEAAAQARATIRTFSFGFFIPLYFAMVGLRLDLVHAFSPVFFAIFFAVACAAKFGSVWLGAKVAGESPAGARNLAVALNARGGPGIVLASVALGAGIIDQNLYAVLVLLAILTSLLAGSWLGRVVRRGEPLRRGSIDSDLPPDRKDVVDDQRHLRHHQGNVHGPADAGARAEDR